MRRWNRTTTLERGPLVIAGLGLMTASAGAMIGAGLALGFDPAGPGLAPLLAAGGLILTAQCGCFAWLLRRFRAHGAVASALRDYGRGEHEAEALRVCEDWGLECASWNALMAHISRAPVDPRSAGVGEERRGAEERGLAEFQICDTLWFGIMAVDREGCVRYSNGASRALLNLDASAAVGATLSRMIPGTEFQESVRSVIDGQILARRSFEVSVAEADRRGIIRFVVRALPGSADAALVVLEDVTQQRAADEARNTFVAQASHELRAPLTNMRLYLETLAGEECEPQSRAQAMNVLMGELKRLERIVSDMLSVAEIESGTLSMHRNDVRVNELLASLEEEFARQAEEKAITLEIDVPPKVPTIHADPGKIALTLHNLVNNAMKYTPSGGRVTVSVLDAPGALVIEVTDTGIGISETDLPRVFERFYRAHDERLAGITGSGLGLSISREIVRRHGGEIEVDSQLNHGSTFRVSLPLTKMAA